VKVTFDPAKDRANVRKHGISLERSEDLDFDAACFDIDDSQDYGEERWNAIGFLDAALHTLTFTNDGEGLRAISLRKADAEEREKYAEEF
jgi:uncharacterized DUF497 family protein